MELGQGVELGHGALGVPQGGGVHGGHHDGPVCGCAGQLEAVPQPGGGVHEHKVEAVLGLVHYGAEPFPVQGVGGEGGGEQKQPLDLRLFRRRLQQGAAVVHHVGEIHHRPVGQAQYQIQVAQADVHVHAQHPAAQSRQAGPHPRGEGGLAGAALSRCDHDGGSHGTPPSDTLQNHTTNL